MICQALTLIFVLLRLCLQVFGWHIIFIVITGFCGEWDYRSHGILLMNTRLWWFCLLLFVWNGGWLGTFTSLQPISLFWRNGCRLKRVNTTIPGRVVGSFSLYWYICFFWCRLCIIISLYKGVCFVCRF